MLISRSSACVSADNGPGVNDGSPSSMASVTCARLPPANSRNCPTGLGTKTIGARSAPASSRDVLDRSISPNRALTCNEPGNNAPSKLRLASLAWLNCERMSLPVFVNIALPLVSTEMPAAGA